MERWHLSYRQIMEMPATLRRRMVHHRKEMDRKLNQANSK